MSALVGYFVLSAALSGSPEPSSADEAMLDQMTPPPRVTDVIQNRKYELGSEFVLLLGGMPADPFYKGLTGSIAYVWHFSDYVAWQVAQLTYSFNIDTQLKREVLRFAPSIDADAAFPRINAILASHLVVKPLYGKLAILNNDVVYVEGFFELGPAFLWRTDPAAPIILGFDFAGGARLWLSRAVSFRLGLGEVLYSAQGRSQGALHLGAGFALNLVGDE